MSEKYIDLIDAIEDSDRMVGCERETVIAVLEFLDRNPDQVPGRKIRESAFREACEYEDQAHRASSPHTYAERVMFALGITVVPDPEPTNAEKLEKIIWASGGPVASISLTRAELLAKWLDEAGVKAPGGES